MKKLTLTPLAAALGLMLATPAFAVGLDFSGSNIYMKFLDGNQRRISLASGDTASGADSGQWTEFAQLPGFPAATRLPPSTAISLCSAAATCC